MKNDMTTAAHLGDAEIMRLIDGDDSNEAARSALHVQTCDHCADQLAALRTDAATVRAWLDRAAFEEAVLNAPGLTTAPAAFPAAARSEPRSAPRTVRTRGSFGATPWLRAAAVLLLLAAPVAAVPALRQLLVDAVADLRGAERTVEASTATAAAGTTVRFVPDIGDFVVRFDAPQTTGTLQLGYRASDEAVLRIVGDAGEGPVISAQSIHVRNTAESLASYVLEVPPAITSLRVRIGGRTAVLLDAAELRSGVELPVR